MRQKGDPSTDMADRPSSSDISLDDITSWVALFVATKQGWRYQIRRSWKVREVPVSESTIFDYEWKIYPSHYSVKGPSDTDEVAAPVAFESGAFYIFRLSEEGFILEHSNIEMAANPYWAANTATIIPFHGYGEREDPHSLVGYLEYLCSNFGPNMYAMT